MYDETIRNLRNESKYALPSQTRKALIEAADVIEKLEITIAGLNEVIKGLADDMPCWIPVTERLPEEPYGCLLVVWDSPQNGGDDFLNYLPYFAGWDGEQWNDADGEQVPFEVVYWRPLPPLPEPPKEET